MIDDNTKGANLRSLSFSSTEYFFDTEKAFIQSFCFSEQVRYYPTFFVNVQVQDKGIIKDLQRYKHYKVSCSTPELNFKTDLCVTKIDIISANTFQLHGYCCHPGFIENYYTRYLGSSQSDIFRVLSTGKKMYSNTNILSKMWQINSNGINTLINFCNSFSNYEYWSITLGEVNLSAKTYLHDYVPLNEIEDSVVYPKREKKIVTSSGNIFSSIGVDSYLFSSEQRNFAKLYAKNLTAKDIVRPTIILNGTYFLSYPLKCGDRMNANAGDMNIKYWEVQSCSYFFSEHTCVCKMQLAGF